MASETTVSFLCDMQEKFRPTIKYLPEIATVANRLVGIIYVSQEILFQCFIFVQRRGRSEPDHGHFLQITFLQENIVKSVS